MINNKNVGEYILNIPDYFYKLCPAHQADFVRVNVLCDYGGIWLDSDTLVLDTLDTLFDLLEDKDGFFIKENNYNLSNGVFGTRKNTPLMVMWKNEIMRILNIKKDIIRWSEIGSNILESLYKKDPGLYENYKIFNGLDNVYPVNWNNCVNEFVNKPYKNYQNIIRPYQPLIILVNSVYKILKDKSEDDILLGEMPLNYLYNHYNHIRSV